MASPRKETNITPYAVYKTLYGHFGPQGWWPVTRGAGAVPRYYLSEYSGKNAKEKFEICTGAILTQNTSWSNVEKALENLNRAGAVSPDNIRKMSRERLASLIRPSGYYNQKALRLKCFARHISKNGGIEAFFDGPPGKLREELLSLKGIGPETADSIILYAAEKPSFVVDAYTLRFGRRIGWFGSDTTYYPARDYLTSRLPRSLKVYNEFHALMAAQCKEFCRKKPSCLSCILRKNCAHEKNP